MGFVGWAFGRVQGLLQAHHFPLGYKGGGAVLSVWDFVCQWMERSWESCRLHVLLIVTCLERGSSDSAAPWASAGGGGSGGGGGLWTGAVALAAGGSQTLLDTSSLSISIRACSRSL